MTRARLLVRFFTKSEYQCPLCASAKHVLGRVARRVPDVRVEEIDITLPEYEWAWERYRHDIPVVCHRRLARDDDDDDDDDNNNNNGTLPPQATTTTTTTTTSSSASNPNVTADSTLSSTTHTIDNTDAAAADDDDDDDGDDPNAGFVEAARHRFDEEKLVRLWSAALR